MIRRLLFHPWLRLRVQIALGLVFIAAALPKIADPPGFAKAIWNYQLFPAWAVHPAALAVPWLELVCGALLCLGLKARAAAAWTGALLLGFVLALSVNLARNRPVDCGCFTTSERPRSDAQRLQDMRWDILRDLGLLLLVLHILGTSPRNSDPRR
ncbi:MAG TPA: MauE/DoxX family redox-associated membrane protein [Holophaga sp.]|nr:MauE/DoxX family redox-associated membrane protein [Holophaga sp.]